MDKGPQRVLPPVDPETLNRIERVLSAHTSKLQQLIDTLRRSIPSYVDDRLYIASGTLVSFPPRTTNLRLITCMIISCTSAAVLTIDDRVWTFAAGTFVWADIALLVRFEDNVSFTQATPGAMSLEMMGIELPDKGPF